MTAARQLLELPPAGSLAEIVLPDRRLHAVRVLEVEDPVLVLGAGGPDVPVTPPRAGETLTLRWGGRRGRCAVPVRVETASAVQFATWTVRPVGGLEVEQRRRFARGVVGGPVHLGPAEPSLGLTLRGHLLDIGEGGLRCRLASGGIDQAQPVTLRLILDDRLIALDAVVLEVVPTGRGTAVDVVVTFTAGPAVAQVIRRYVLHRQVGDRAAGDDPRRPGSSGA